jgi:RHS repeat-associated protein
VYDPFHRQAEKTATITGTSKTRFIYSGWQRIADYDSVSGALQNRYVYGTGLDEPLIQVSAAGVLTFLHANHQGSVLAITDSAGAVTDKNAYGPFGEGAPTGTTFGYTGQRYDSESGLHYYKRRYFDSATGRFLQPDPIGYQIEAACGCSCAGGCGDDAKPSQLNLYLYVRNNTLKFVDPFGLAPAPAAPAVPGMARPGTVGPQSVGLGINLALSVWAVIAGLEADQLMRIIEQHKRLHALEESIAESDFSECMKDAKENRDRRRKQVNDIYKKCPPKSKEEEEQWDKEHEEIEDEYKNRKQFCLDRYNAFPYTPLRFF